MSIVNKVLKVTNCLAYKIKVKHFETFTSNEILKLLILIDFHIF